MVKTGYGFGLLRQESKPEKTTFMDYEPGHAGDENYRKTNTKISNQTNTTNKSGNTKSTAAITQEPKREAFSWSDDDFLEGWNSVYNDEPKKESSAEKLRQTRERLQNIGSRQASRTFGGSYKWTETPIFSSITSVGADSRSSKPSLPKGGGTAGWRWEDSDSDRMQRQTKEHSADQDRLFFEGLFDVDGATGDYEREERTAQVNEALRDMEKRKLGDMLRWSMGNTVQPTKYNAPVTQTPRAEFHPAPSWYQPLEESNDDVVNAGREHGKNILEDEFNQGWLYALGKENIYDYSSPIYNSRYKNVLTDSAKDNAKAEFVAGLGASVNPIRDTII